MEKLDPTTKSMIGVELLSQIKEANDLLLEALKKGDCKSKEEEAFTIGKAIGRLEAYMALEKILEDK